MAKISGLTVRQHERKGIELGIEFVVAEPHRPQVRFSPSSAAIGQATLRGTAVDISPGGMGLCFGEFLPRMTEGTVRIFNPTPIGAASDGTPIYESAFEHGVKVRRVYMSGHEPTYSVGVSFVNPEPELEQRIRLVLALVAEEERKLEEESGDGPEGGADA